jgi:hypothetical protein
MFETTNQIILINFHPTASTEALNTAHMLARTLPKQD